MIRNVIYAVCAAILLFGCSKNATSIPSAPISTVTDIDGNIYPTILIGHQTWMAANLKTTKYANGDSLANGWHTGFPFYSSTVGAFTYPNDSVQYNDQYGKLYDNAAIEDPRGVCPISWHVPTNADWSTLFQQQGNSGSSLLIGGSSAMSLSLAGYMLPRPAVLGGDVFDQFGLSGWYASSTIFNVGAIAGLNPIFDMAFNTHDDSTEIHQSYNSYCVSIRCVKD